MTKKLLQDVFNKLDIKSIDEQSDDKIWYTMKGDTLSSYMKKNDLFFKLKDWAKERGFGITSGYNFNKELYNASVHKNSLYVCNNFSSESEFEAVGLACEWILKYE